MNDPACEGIIGSIAYRFDGDRLRLVRFSAGAFNAKGVVTLKRLVSYDDVRANKAGQSRRLRARRKARQ